MVLDREMLLEHLARAERHVVQGQTHIHRQREIVADLERDGHAKTAAQARELLSRFEETQTLYIADRDRLLNELAED